MKKSILLIALALGVSGWSVSAQDQGGPPAAGDAPPPHHFGPPGGPGGHPGFHVLPPRAMEELNLTDAQRKQIADLEKEVKAKVEQILTPEQLEKMKQMPPPLHPRGPGMGGPPPGAPPMGGPGAQAPGGSPPDGGPSGPQDPAQEQ